MRFQLFCFFIALLTSVKGELSDCSAILIDHTYYNLCPLANSPPINFTTESRFFTFSFGQKAVQSCHQQRLIWGKAYNNDECFDFPNLNMFRDKNKSRTSEGLILSSQSTQFEDQTIFLTFNLSCDKHMNKIPELNITIDSTQEIGPTTYVNISSTSFYGCPVATSNKIWDFIIENEVFFAPPLIVIGFIYCFFGLRFEKPIIYSTHAGAGVLLVGLFIEEMSNFTRSRLILLSALFLLISSDIVLSKMTFKNQSTRFLVLGIAFGTVKGIIIYDTMLSPILKANEGDTIFYIVIAMSAAVSAYIAFVIQKDGFIVFSGFIGAYLVVRPISAFLGGFPSEIEVASGLIEYDTTAYGYLLGILIIAALGIKYQYIHYKKMLRVKKVKDEMIEFSEYMRLI